MKRVAGLSLVLVLLAPVLGGAGEVEILEPGPRFRAGRDTAWLVLRAAEEPAVFLDDSQVAATVAADGVYHYRLHSPRGGGAILRIAGSGETGLAAPSAASVGFHASTTTACWECHDAGGAGCVECHVGRGASKHRPVQAEGCVRCHVLPDRSTGDLGVLCVGCHPEYGSGRHGRIRHAVASDRDPSRPGRKMDCASCHDPHAPTCLSCLGRGELRAWCKRCHGGP